MSLTDYKNIQKEIWSVLKVRV